MKIIIITILLLQMMLPVGASNRTDSLLRELNHVLDTHDAYVNQKLNRIESLKTLLKKKKDNQSHFDIYGLLYDEYLYFNSDSTLRYAQLRLNTAIAMNQPEYIDLARTNVVEILQFIGLYKEAFDYLREIKPANFPRSSKAYYYNVCTELYMNMYLTSHYPDIKKKYGEKSMVYRDSLLNVTDPTDFIHIKNQVHKLNEEGKYDESIALLQQYRMDELDDYWRSAWAYYYSTIYYHKNNPSLSKDYIIESAIYDMKRAARDYIALPLLSDLLYKEGDYRRAFRYITHASQDAKEVKAALRIQELGTIEPQIVDSTLQKIQRQRQQITYALATLGIFAVLLTFIIWHVYKQKRNLKKAHDDIRTINRQLTTLNSELSQTNTRLRESDTVKEEYISRYLDQCATYLNKLDTYRRSLNKIAMNGKAEELNKALKSTDLIDEEQRNFYRNFDETFLHLYPGFIEEFNALLLADEKIHPKPGELLTTELRIYALLRLGITDSAKMAKFLNYNVTTIYNYRVKVRNKAIEREAFEENVAGICKE